MAKYNLFLYILILFVKVPIFTVIIYLPVGAVVEQLQKNNKISLALTKNQRTFASQF